MSVLSFLRQGLLKHLESCARGKEGKKVELSRSFSSLLFPAPNPAGDRGATAASSG